MCAPAVLTGTPPGSPSSPPLFYGVFRRRTLNGSFIWVEAVGYVVPPRIPPGVNTANFNPGRASLLMCERPRGQAPLGGVPLFEVCGDVRPLVRELLPRTRTHMHSMHTHALQSITQHERAPCRCVRSPAVIPPVLFAGVRRAAAPRAAQDPALSLFCANGARDRGAAQALAPRGQAVRCVSILFTTALIGLQN